MDGLALMKNTLFFFFGFLFSVTFALYSSVSHAVTFSSQSVLRAVPTSSGATVSAQYAGKTAANQAVYVMRAVSIPKASIASVGRLRLLSPWGLAIAAATVAAGYVIDELTGEVTETGAIILPDTGLGTCYYTTSGGAPQNLGDFTYSDCVNPLLIFGNVNHQSTHHSWVSNLDGQVYTDAGPGQNPVSDSDFYDLLASLPNSEFQQLFENPISGQPNSEFPEFGQIASDISVDYNSFNDGDENTNVTYNFPEGDTGLDTLSDEPPPVEDPCVKNPDLVSCLETGDAPDETEIVTQDIDYDYSQHSLSSNSSCPSGYDNGFGVTTYQPVCDFMIQIKPIVIVVSSLGALLIISGFGRGSET